MTAAISARGLALIRKFEGFRAEPAPLPEGGWVVGHGHVRADAPGGPVTLSEADELLELDLAPFERLVNARVAQPLKQSQFDALVSFAFSVGEEAFEQSQVLRRVNAGDFVAAACAMDAWRKAEIGGEIVTVDALVRRRAAEKALFLRHLPHEAAPSALVRARLDHAASILGAPITYASAPILGEAVAPAVAEQPKFEPGERLTEILQSEPATAAVLAAPPIADEIIDEGEIVTAHAKPVARPLAGMRARAQRAYASGLRLFARARLERFAELGAAAQTARRRLRGLRERGAAALRSRLSRLDLAFRRRARANIADA